MIVFETNTIVISSGQINGELFIEENPKVDYVNLDWIIELKVQPLNILNRQYRNVQIVLGSFSLPFFNKHTTQNIPKTISNWNELEYNTFEFIDAEQANIAQIYYTGTNSYKLENGEVNDADECYDNIITIRSIEFGKINRNTIEFKCNLKIEFNHFNVHYQPFYEKDLECPYFQISTSLEFGRIRFINGGYEIKNLDQAMYLASHSVNTDIYSLKSEIKTIKINRFEEQFKQFFYLLPKLID